MILTKKQLILWLWQGILGMVILFVPYSTYGGEMSDDLTENLVNLKISYRLEGAYSHYRYIQIEISGSGEGKLSYELYREYLKGAEKEKVILFEVDQATIEELVHQYENADFFNVEVNDLNKDKINITDVGTTTLAYHRSNGKERTLSYGYIKNNPLRELIKLYLKLAKKYLPEA